MEKFFLICILVLAAFFRFWNIGNVPPSPSMDEASIGYNAYSVLNIGVDEFGEFPLISQRGYDDWRRSTYLFLTIPFIKLFGLNALAVRLPSAILSVLTVLFSYLLVKMLFKAEGSNQDNTKNKVGIIALFTSFFLAISPWHIYISRLGHESNACLSFFVFGIYFFLKGESEKKWLLILISGIFFVLSMISYYSGQAFIPLFVLGIIFIYRKTFFSIIVSNKKSVISFLIFLIFLIPVFFSIFSPKALIRFQGTSTFSPQAHQELFDKRVKLRNQAVSDNNLFGTVFYNRHLFPAQVFLQGYFSHFNLKWLFTNSSSEPFKIPEFGLIYKWELFFIIIGIISLIFSPFFNIKTQQFILIWIILAPVPAALATQAPHAMRTYNFLPSFQILSALGITYMLFKFNKIKKIILFCFFILAAVTLIDLYKNYFFIFPKQQSASFQYALSKTIPYVFKNEGNYNKIVFSNQENLYQSFMLFLFHTKYDPYLYQEQGGTKSGGFAKPHEFGKYEFRPIKWDKEIKTKKTLYIGNFNDFPNEPAVQFFENLDKKKVIKIVENY